MRSEEKDRDMLADEVEAEPLEQRLGFWTHLEELVRRTLELGGRRHVSCLSMPEKKRESKKKCSEKGKEAVKECKPLVLNQKWLQDM